VTNKLFRVETIEGNGPYFGTAIDSLGDDGDLRYGFSNLDRFYEWFNPRQRAELAQLGSVLATYKINDVKNSGGRCVLSPRNCCSLRDSWGQAFCSGRHSFRALVDFFNCLSAP
jgi:hypothetical protein